MIKVGSIINNKSAPLIIVKAWDFEPYNEVIRYAKLMRIRRPSEFVQFAQNEFCKELELAGASSIYPRGVWGVGYGSGVLNLYSGDGSTEFKMLNLWRVEDRPSEIIGEQGLVEDLFGYKCINSVGRIITNIIPQNYMGVVIDQQEAGVINSALLTGSSTTAYNVSAFFIQPRYDSSNGSWCINTNTSGQFEYGFASGDGSGLYHAAHDPNFRQIYKNGTLIHNQTNVLNSPNSPNRIGVMCFEHNTGISGGRVGSKVSIFIGTSALTGGGMPSGINTAYNNLLNRMRLF